MPVTDSFTTEDIAYLRHGDRPLMMRLYRPEGGGPFPAVIDIHGGAWTTGDLADCQPRDEVLAKSGLLVAAINFRHAADGYPTSLADINYAIRWLKTRAGEFGADPARVGLCGQSSGGHLAMLTAMRPDDPRYAAIKLAGNADASVASVAMLWPVINPLSRYRHALRARDNANPPAWVGNIPERHDQYWKTEAAMAEGNPMLILERGEKVEMPPAIWIQGRPDPTHDYHDPDSGFAGPEPDRFVANYRKAGGDIDLAVIDNATRASLATWQKVAAFFSKAMG